MEKYTERAHQEIIQERLRARANGFTRFEPSDLATISELFEEQAGRDPSKHAVVDGRGALTFAELQRFSNGVSRAVRRAVKERRPVAVLTGRHTHFVAAALGVLGAGGAYVPLDPRFPESRNARIMSDVGAGVVLTEAGLMPLAQRLSPHNDALICLEEVEWQTSVPRERADEDGPACIVFTSGSTGAPKGVIQTQRNLLQVVRRYTNSLFLGHADRVSLLSSCSVTASIAPMLSSLLNGATLSAFSVLDRGMDALADWLESERITLYHSVPSLLRHLLQSIAPDRVFADVAVVRLGGDSAYRSDWELFARHFSADAVLVNSYGCSEMSSVSRFYMDRTSHLIENVLPVGCPMVGVEISLASAAGTRPIVGDSMSGVRDETDIGEIVLESRYLSPGYWKKGAGADDASVRRAGLPDVARYSTGDLGILRPNQGLVHVGRCDSQVKLSGFRVELAEVDACLREYPGVRTAATSMQTASHGDQRVIGFVEFDSAEQVSAEEIRAHLARNLPSFMVPAEIVIAREVPLTPNGKVDRARLPELYAASRRVKSGRVPQTSVERLLAQIWQSLLRLSEVNAEDNFFACGGNSLLALRVTNELRSHGFGALSARAIFDHPTIAELAVALAAADPRSALTEPSPAQPRPDCVPMSFSQRRLWFLERLGGTGTAYTMVLPLRLRGVLDGAALVRALNELVRRHEVLRTRFETVGGEGVQRIETEAHLRLREVNLSEMEAASREAALRQLQEEMLATPFDLENEVPFRGLLMRLSEREHELVLTMHHIISDGWSLDIVTREIGALYAAFAAGQPSPLADLDLQYADYALWERARLQGATLERQLAYWRTRLAGVPMALSLPTDRMRPAVQSYRGAALPVVLSAGLTAGLTGLARHEGASLFMVLLAAFQVLLARWSGQDEVVVGSPIAGRNHRALEGLIGFFVNNLALNAKIGAGESFCSLLRQVKTTTLEAYAHQDLPFEKLVGELAPVRDMSRHPVFQVAFNFQNENKQDCQWPGLDVQSRRVGDRLSSKFDLSVHLRETENALQGVFEFSTDLFDIETISRLSRRFIRLLENIVADPLRRLSAIDLLDEAERHQQLVEWNAAARAYPQDKCIHELFDEQAARTPDRIGLVHEGNELTFREIDGRANALAHCLIDQGVAPGSLVGLCVEGDVGRTVGLLGILKAGGACVPLDPDDPVERLDYLMEDSGAGLIVTQSSVRSRVELEGAAAEWLVRRCVELEGVWHGNRRKSPGVVMSATDLACVRYEADQTGVPLGVMWSHASAVEGPMGGAEKSSDGLFAPMLRWLTKSSAVEVSAGVRRQAEAWGGARYILDRHENLLPVGAVGELYVGGEGVGWGYRHRSGLTAERFVPNAFSVVPGERLYRTGERARWTAKGKLELIGLDESLRDGGKREDLQEIERALLSHEGVREAIVVALEAAAQPSLAAYVVEQAPDATPAVRFVSQLKAHLRAQPRLNRLPDEWMVLKALPRTADETVDSAALPRPKGWAAEPKYVAPEGVTEELLAELWCVLLGHERVGRHDNFFELGGHSLLATQLVSRIREIVSAELPLRELFDHPTLSSQARAVERARTTGALADFPVQAVARDEPLPLSYAQQRLWFLHRYMGPSAVYNMPLALRLRGKLDESALMRSLEELHQRHEALRTRFELHEGGAVQVIDPPGLEIEVEAVSAAEAQVIARAERCYYFNLSSDRLCRIRLLRETGRDSDAGNYVLLITMHHSVSDGWSLGIFFRELVSLYRAYTNGEDSPLAPLLIQYADYAQWQRRWLQGELLEQQVSYWRAQLNNLPPLLTLPTDRPRPAEQSFRGSTERFALPLALTERLRALSREQGVTLYMTLLSAFAVLLGRYAGQRDVAIGTPIANRTRRETEGLIGFFVNTLVMRHDLRGDPRFVDLLKCTRLMALQAYAHQDVPFEQLVEELNPPRRVSHSPLFQVAFALQNAPFEALELPALAIEPLDAGATGEDEEGKARFDLTLSVRESPTGLVGRAEYNKDLFDRETIRRMLDHYAQLLEAIGAAPHARLSQLKMLGEEERHRQLVEWNARSWCYPRDKSVHALFEEQADRSPEAIVVIDGDRQLTRQEVNEQANAGAHRLIERGVVPGSVVGLWVDGEVERLVGLLAILKAGGAYVPLNADTPMERLDYLLEDSEIELIVTQASVRLRVAPEGREAESLKSRYVELEAALPDGRKSRSPWVGVSAAHLACVRYEAHPTGVPVGVMCSHVNVLEEWINCDAESPTATQGRWSAALLSKSAVNVSAAQVRGASRFVLDGDGELLPIGAVGELYVGGEGVGWGYRHRSGLTAERFVPNAFSVVPGERLYRTGERARWTAKGKLELIGLDESLRDEGKREDLREIERALLSHDGVREAIVVALEATAQPSLAAYVVEQVPDATPAERFVSQLKTHLRAQPRLNRLPDEWMVMTSLPRTAVGGVDRSGLPQPKGLGEGPPYVAARTALESTLVEVWQEQLGIARVGIEDNYFVLGGDSIRSIPLVAEARKRGALFSIKDLFAHPTVSALASALERGAVRQEVVAEEEIGPFALLTDQERARLSQRHDMEALEDAYPLSMMQQGMAVESLRHADLMVYQNGHCYRFNDAWDSRLFEQALRHLMARHAMLRAVYDLSGERPLQLVLKEKAPALNVVDVRHLDEAAIQAALEQWRQKESSEPLEVSSSLWRLTIHVLSDQSFIFGMFIHHAQWDGWSLESFATELYATYGLLKREGRIAQRQRLPSYNRFIALEQSAVSSEEHRENWTRKLKGATAPWWAGRKKSASAYMTCDVSQETSLRLSELAGSLGVQEKGVWFSAYATLLSLLNGTDEVLGTVITQGRPEIPDGDKMIGVFLNGLPTRVRISGGRWADLITAMDRELREQHTFRHYPTAEIQRLTGLDLSAAMFHYANWHVYYQGVDREGTPGEWIPQKVGGWQETNYLLNFLARKDDKTQRYRLVIGADTQVFDADFRERIRGYAARIIDAIAGDVTAVVSKTALLSDEERHRQLIEWNATSQAYPDEKCIHELFEEQARLRPDAVAVVHEGHELTYEELNRRANQVAHCLREQGVGPEVRTGICLRRSAELAVGLLAILKAGGAYVPLDPEYPQARLEYMLAQSGCRIVLSERYLMDVPLLSTTTVLLLDADAHDALFGAYSDANVAVADIGVCPTNLAYVIYTSGSTGQPKGSAIIHQNISRLIFNDFIDFGSVRTILCAASPSFDAFTFELWGALLHGGRSVMADATRGSFGDLGRVVDQQGVDCAWLTSSLFNQLIVDSAESLKNLKRLLVGGEALSIDHVREGLRQLPQTMLINGYGPTENTTFSCTNAIHEEKLSGHSSVPIGRPIGNTQAYVLEVKGELVPAGVVGELYLGGAGLARGYLGNAGLTAERFVPSAFARAPGERLYRTGDLARWLSDGMLEFLGRVDTQVKVRGFRIELGEIESVLVAHEAVCDAVVVLREDSGDQRLVGYVVAEVCTQPDEIALIQGLRAHLQKQLPGYMVPSALMVLESLPLTANGKLDRKALPAPEESESESEHVPPEGSTEELLAGLWCAVLKRERVGRHDSFFEIGGHSLLATLLASRIRTSFRIELPIRVVFDSRTLQEQALAIETEKEVAARRAEGHVADLHRKFAETRNALVVTGEALEVGEI